MIIKPVYSIDEKSITIFHSSNINLFDVKNKNLSKNKLKTLKNKFDKEVKETFNDPFFDITSYSYEDGTRNGL